VAKAVGVRVSPSAPFRESGIGHQRSATQSTSRALHCYLIPNRPDPEKLSPYECGFEAFEDARMKFDVRYYLVAILFILFDLEIAFLFPWAVVLPDIGYFGFVAMMIFLAILTIGFVYEWKKGALEWE
jgi:NADH-quinone oxidoreductase subunit A